MMRVKELIDRLAAMPQDGIVLGYGEEIFSTTNVRLATESEAEALNRTVLMGPPYDREKIVVIE